MAWLYQQNGSKNWWLGYRVNGKQVLRSTKTSVRAEAERELEKVELLFGANRAGSLTEELFTALTGGGLPKITLEAEVNDWLAECRATTAEKTIVRYEAFAKEFKLALSATKELLTLIAKGSGTDREAGRKALLLAYVLDKSIIGSQRDLARRMGVSEGRCSQMLKVIRRKFPTESPPG